jgi:hypothetical protein
MTFAALDRAVDPFVPGLWAGMKDRFGLSTLTCQFDNATLSSTGVPSGGDETKPSTVCSTTSIVRLVTRSGKSLRICFIRFASVNRSPAMLLPPRSRPRPRLRLRRFVLGAVVEPVLYVRLVHATDIVPQVFGLHSVEVVIAGIVKACRSLDIFELRNVAFVI